MPVRSHLPGPRFANFRGVAVRTGIQVGVCLSLVFLAWLLVANRAPAFERFALERNIAAAAGLGFFGLIPVLRFHRAPCRLWASGVVAWLLLSASYRLMSMFFPGLGERYSAFQVFMLGAVVYTIVSTLCWIGTVVRRMRASQAPVSPTNRIT